MTSADLIPLLPILVVGVAAFAVMLVIAFHRDHELTVALTVAGLAVATATLFLAVPAAPHPIAPLLVVDRYALVYQGLLFAASIAVALLAHGYFGRRGEDREEYYLLLLISTFGGAILATANHFASFFIGLEILSVPLYAMIAYNLSKEESIEAGIKYLVLAGASAAFLLLGIALVYYESGTLEFAKLASLPALTTAGVLFVAGSALLIVGFGFKLAVVPFHLWTPDVYQGAPAPTTAFIATVSKGAVFALLFRYFRDGSEIPGNLLLVFAIIAIASMIVGNVLALRQDNVKRVLAYSSISHLGYLLVAFIAGGKLGATAATFYLAAYFATALGAFGVVSALSTRDHEAEHLDHYRGLAWRRPWLAAAFAVCLISLAGIPLTAGFVGKFLLISAGVGATQWLLVVTLVATSTVGLVYYLRIATTLFSRVGEDAVASPLLAWPTGVALAVLVVVVLWLGLYPAPLIDAIQASLG